MAVVCKIYLCMYLYSIYVLVGHKMWFSAFSFLFYFEGHFISKKCGKMRMLNHGNEVGEYTWTRASCDVDFFVCIHELRMMYIDSTHHFHGKGLFLFQKKCFCNFGSPTSVNPDIEGDLIFFLSFPISLHLSLVPKLVLVGWFDQPRLGFDVILTLV